MDTNVKPQKETKEITCTGGLEPLKRNQYFYGKLLTVKDFETEQSYFIKKQRLINKHIHGEGIVCGLDVVLDGELGKTNKIKIKSGIALDCCGREIIVPYDVEKEVEKEVEKDGTFWVTIAYNEEGSELVASTTQANACEERCCYSHTVEKFRIRIKSKKPDVCSKVELDCENSVQKKQSSCQDKKNKPLILAVGNFDGGKINWINDKKYDINFEKKLIYSNAELYELIKCGGEVEKKADFITITKLSWEHNGTIDAGDLFDPGLTITFSENIQCLYTHQSKDQSFYEKTYPEFLKVEFITQKGNKNIYFKQDLVASTITIKNKLLTIELPKINKESEQEGNEIAFYASMTIKPILLKISLNCNFIRDINNKIVSSGPYDLNVPKKANLGLVGQGKTNVIPNVQEKGTQVTHAQNSSIYPSCGIFESWVYVLPSNRT